MELIAYVGERIRALRKVFNGGTGLSQDALAEMVGTTANTVSRWETGVYRPSLEDLEKIARVFGVALADLFPPSGSGHDQVEQEARLNALLRAARALPAAEIDELRRYAEFRQFRAAAPKMGIPVRRKKKDPAE